MNKIFTRTAFVAVASALTLGAASCNDELTQKPIDYPASGSFWETQTQFVGNIYANSCMMRDQTPNILFWAGELRAGRFTTALINQSGAVNTNIVNNDYAADRAQFSTFGGWYGFVANMNELIQQCEKADPEVISENVKNGLLGIAHGWRAYAYFQMYKMYGGVPLRLQPDVQDGITDPTKLYMPRATAEQTLTQIKTDIATSLDCFNKSTFQINAQKKAYYWSKAATEMLAGEVYLWSAKVATGDHALGGASDVAIAKGYFENVVNNYGYKMIKDYFSVWTTPLNTESIYSICYSSDIDKVSFSSYQGQILYSHAGGDYATVGWTTLDATGLKIRKDGAASQFNKFTTAANQTGALYTTWTNFQPSPNRYMYKNAAYFQFDDKDVRKEMFFPVWEMKDNESNLTYIANFDPTQYVLSGTFTSKFEPVYKPDWDANRMVWPDDQCIYRLPLAYMYLAEIANYEGNNGQVEHYINLVRERAYGDNWDVNVYGYHAGSFRENEVAILQEKDKEFIMEGQRWWDLRRLTAVKDGAQLDHLVFQPESCAGWGLNPVANPWLVDGDGNVLLTATPVLSANEEYKLLWPIDQALLNSDPEIEQNPGY